MRKQLLLTTVMVMLAIMAHAQKYVGGDISLLTQYETHGTKYFDENGNSIPNMLQYFKGQGLNSMRVRLFVDPSNASAEDKGQGVCQDLEYVKALGKRIKDAGMTLMLDFHYSDSWADPVKQWTPKAWQSLSDEQLYTKIYEYTKDVLSQMKAAGATPDFIQTGNEISYGMLWGTSNSDDPKKADPGNPTNWNRFMKLLEQAAKACREECPQAKIIIHTELVRNLSLLKSYYNAVTTDYDIIGLSYYPYYHGNLTQLKNALNAMKNDHPDKEIMIVETGYYYAWQPSNVNYDISGTYPITPAGQQAFTKALIELLNGYDQVTGLYWWMMEASENGLDWNTKRVTDGWYNASLFNDSSTDTGWPAGKVMPAMQELQNFLEGSAGISATAVDTPETATWYTIDGRRLNAKPTMRGLYIHDGKKIIIN